MLDKRQKNNAVFLLKNSLNGLSFSIDNLVNPVSKIDEDARATLSFSQIVAIENSFSLRTVHLKKMLGELKHEMIQNDDIILSKVDIIRKKLEMLRNVYLRSEMVFGYYIDLLHTRALINVGKALKGYDVLSKDILQIFLRPLGHVIPEVVVYLEQIGDGAAIMRADISLWDRIRNPCAIIKLPQSSLYIPRSSIVHEVGHQIGSITGLNKETASLLYNTIRSEGGSERLANYWKLCSTEIIADQIATQLTNWISALTLYNIYSGSAGSSIGFAGRMFNIIPNDPHLMGYLRIRSSLESCRQAFGKGPWDDMVKSLEILYPVSLASPFSLNVIQESLPLIPKICQAFSKARFSSLNGKSFEHIFPMSKTSPNSVKKFLNINLTTFSVGANTRLKYPIHTLVGFGILQMLGGNSIHWIANGMQEWLAALGRRNQVS